MKRTDYLTLKCRFRLNLIAGMVYHYLGTEQRFMYFM